MTTDMMQQDDIETRLNAWRERGDPECLWPRVRTADRLRAHEAITSVTGAVLNGRVPAVLTFDPDCIEALGVAAYVSGMGPLLGWWIEQGCVSADANVAMLFTKHLAANRARAAKLRAELARVLDAAAARDVTVMVLKGSHVAHVYFPDAGTRPATDIDLLVEPHSKAAMREALLAAGYFESRSTEYPERSEWSLRGVAQQLQSLEMEHPDSPWSIDLHTHLDKSYFRGLRAGFGERPFASAVATTLDGQYAHVLAQPLLTAYLALSASHSIEELRLLRVAELVMVLRRDVANEDLDWKALAALVAESGTARFTYPIFELAEQLVPGLVPRDFQVLLKADTTARLRRVVARVGAGRVELGGRSIAEKLMWSRGVLQVSRNLVDLIMPPDSGLSLRELRQSYVRRARRAIRRQLVPRLANSNHGSIR